MSGALYTPRSGSSCDKALTAIRAHGNRLSEDAMSVVLDVGIDEVRGLLAYPVKLGVLKRFREGDVVWWDNGDGVPLAAPPPPPPEPIAAAEVPETLGEQVEQPEAAIDIPQFVPGRRRTLRRHAGETLVGGAGPALLPVKPVPAPTYPLDDEHSFEIPIPNKAGARITLPADFDARDWKYLQAVMSAYANRLAPVAA